MKTYRVVNDCVRMPFARRRFYKDEIVELEDSIVPGANFELVEGPVKPKEQVNNAVSLSELQTKQKDLATPKSGFASKHHEIQPEKKVTHPKKKTAR